MAMHSSKLTRKRHGQRRTPSTPKPTRVGIDDRATDLVWQVCGLAGRPNLINDVRKDLPREGILGALRQHDTPVLYNWMVRGVAFQGISDYVAYTYMDQHGSATWDQIEESLASQASCSKLGSYWQFHKCGYDKTSQGCNAPSHLAACPLPGYPLRNGR
jgi:hypothetical protein